jgi:hypothetical protein
LQVFLSQLHQRAMFLNAAFQDRVREVIAGHSAQVRQHAKHPLATPLAWMHHAMVRHFSAAITPAISAQLLHLFSTITSKHSPTAMSCVASEFSESQLFFIRHLFLSNSSPISPILAPPRPSSRRPK